MSPSDVLKEKLQLVRSLRMKSYIVLGLGRFGKSIAKALYDMGYDVVGADINEKLVDEFSRHITHAVQADITSEDFLRSMDIKRYDAAIVAVGSNIQISILVTVLLKEMNAKFVLVKAQDDFQEKILYKIGADKVILPEKEIGIKAARNLATDNFFDMIEISPEYSITSVSPPNSWLGKTLNELSARKLYGINIIAVKDATNKCIIPDANTVIESGSIITVMGNNNDLDRLGN